MSWAEPLCERHSFVWMVEGLHVNGWRSLHLLQEYSMKVVKGFSNSKQKPKLECFTFRVVGCSSKKLLGLGLSLGLEPLNPDLKAMLFRFRSRLACASYVLIALSNWNQNDVGFVQNRKTWIYAICWKPSSYLHFNNCGSKFVCETCTCVQLHFARARRRWWKLPNMLYSPQRSLP